MGFELMELRTDGSRYEFIIRETIMNEIVRWNDFSEIDTVKKYLEKHHFPKDSLYPEEDFIEEIEGSDRFIHLIVEKPETADFILNMCCELI
jgi:hypothetical protein